MTSPNIPISPRIDSGKSPSEKEKSDRPGGKVDADKFRRVLEVEDQKLPNNPILDDEEIDLKKAKEKKFAENKKRATSTQEHSSKSIFDLAKEKPSAKNEPPSSRSDLIQHPFQEGLSENQIISKSLPQEPISKVEKLQEIIDKITSEILHLESEKKGESSTLIILKDSGTFKEVSIKISDFDSSKKEFNITIDNLSPTAKTLIEKGQNSLIERLATLGYTVQNFTATSVKVNERIMIGPSEKPSEKKEDRENPSKKDNKK